MDKSALPNPESTAPENKSLDSSKPEATAIKRKAPEDEKLEIFKRRCPENTRCAVQTHIVEYTKFILKVLQKEGPLTAEDLYTITRGDPEDIDFALSGLVTTPLVRKVPLESDQESG